MKKQKLIDDIIPEPLGGVHRDKETMFKTVEKYITKSYKELKDLSTKDLVAQRMENTVKWENFQINKNDFIIYPSYLFSLIRRIFFDILTKLNSY